MDPAVYDSASAHSRQSLMILDETIRDSIAVITIVVMIGCCGAPRALQAQTQRIGIGLSPHIGIGTELGTDGYSSVLGVDAELRTNRQFSIAVRGTWFVGITQLCELLSPSPYHDDGWSLHVGPRFRGFLWRKEAVRPYLYLGVGPTTTFMVEETQQLSVLTAVGLDLKISAHSYGVIEANYQSVVPRVSSKWDLFQVSLGLRFVTGWERQR